MPHVSKVSEIPEALLEKGFKESPVTKENENLKFNPASRNYFNAELNSCFLPTSAVLFRLISLSIGCEEAKSNIHQSGFYDDGISRPEYHFDISE